MDLKNLYSTTLSLGEEVACVILKTHVIALG
jgi:hypothetical protein